MPAGQPTKVDNTDYRIGALLFRRMWRLTRPYWFRSGAWLPWMAFSLLMGGVAFGSFFPALLSFRMKWLTDALIDRRPGAFEAAALGYIGIWLTMRVVDMLSGLIEPWLSGDWRLWMTRHLVEQYLEHRTYYDIAVKEDLDNPDERLQASVYPFVRFVALLPSKVFYQIGTIAGGIVVLTSIGSNLLLWCLVVGALQLIASWFLAIPAIRLSFRETIAEANLRSSLTHIRENAEAIAFYHGEPAERAHIFARAAAAMRRQRATQLFANCINGLFSNIFSLGWLVLPYVMLAPRVMSGELTFGAITQAAVAVNMVMSSMMQLAEFNAVIAEVATPTVRLAQIQERLAALRKAPLGHRVTVRRDAESIRIRDVSLETPGGEQKLVRQLSLFVSDGTNIAIVGPTGVGKSSLLRSMAGLWTRGEGLLEMPPPERCLFLPQRPYMILADLRSQLTYPHGADVDDACLWKVLDAVNLRHSVTKHGGLSVVRDWTRVLSLGEQQRIAFSRVLVSKPRFVFLDEATSAVDYETETRLYRLLAATGANYVSVGHRLSILDHHTHVLTLDAGGGWSLEARGPNLDAAVGSGAGGLAS